MTNYLVTMLMWKIIRGLSWLSLILVIFMLQIVVAYFLPYPFNHINSIFALLVWCIFYYKNTGKVSWLALACSFFIELFSFAPFGSNLLALIISVMIISWFLTTIFINHSWYIALISGIVGLICYRLIFLALVSLSDLVHHTWHLPAAKLLFSFIWETTLTAGIITIMYLISIRALRRFNPLYVTLKK